MSPALPPSLQRQFAFLERRLWQIDALVALAGGLGSLLLSFFCQFASDRLWDTPPWLRAIFAVAGWAGLVFFAWQYGSRWVWKRRSTRDLAIIVQRRYRRLGDRLLGIVELADPASAPTGFSPELCAAAIAQVAGDASSFEFRAAVGTKKPRKYLTWFFILGAVIALFAIVTPQAGWNALQRWLWPASAVSRYTFVTLRDLPDHLVVAQGEPFEITVGVAANSFWHPQKATFHFEGQSASAAAIRGGSATFQLAGQTQPRQLWLSVGDASRSIRIEPELRPDLRQLGAHLDLPDYLQYPPLDQPIEAGSLTFLPGTKAVFNGEAVRELGSAELQGEKAVPLPVQGRRFHTAPMLLEKETALRFAWKDRFGLAGPAAASVHLVPKEDAPPEVELRGLEAAIAILPGEVVPMDLGATDDYGVKHLALTWQIGSPAPDIAPGAVHEVAIADGKPQLKTLGGHYDFSALLLEIPPDSTVLLRATAIDYFPRRTPAKSPLYRIHVLSPEEHARLVHDEFEKLLAQLEELARRQEKLLQAGQQVQAAKPQLAKPETGEKLGEQTREQQATADQLNQLAAKTAEVLKEALRNPELSPATLQEWAKHAQAMSQLANAEMPKAAQSLASAQSDPGQRSPKLDQALQQEQKILEAMHNMERDTNQSLERLTAQTLGARLKRAAATEKQIADQFQQRLPEEIGLKPAQLPTEAQHALNANTASHDAVTHEAGHVHEEISRLFDRTSLARYGDVAKEMETQKTEDALAQAGDWMKGNVGTHAIDAARHWSDQFGKWAARLSDDDQSKTAQNSQPGSGQNSAAQQAALLALMRLRQQQEQTRDQTEALNEHKDGTPDFSSQAQTLAQGQSGLHDALQELQQTPGFPIPPEDLAPPGKAMGEAASSLAKPETGKPTINAQTDALNLLDAAIQKSAQKSGSSMAALMQMMGMGQGNGKGSMAGGMPGGPNVPVTGSAEGSPLESLPVPGSVGLDHSALPPEFRDAIESYHRALEQSSLP